MMVPILARFRTLYESASIPLGKLCLRLGLTPDMLTILSLMTAGLASYVTAQGAFWWGIVLILLVGFLDSLDGATARAGGTANPFGTVFDHVVDRYAEFLILLGVMLSGAVSGAWTIFAISGMVMASYVRAVAESTGLLECNVGFAGRQEKLAILLLGMALEPLVPTWRLLEWATIGVGVVSHITAIQRLLYTRRVIRNAPARDKEKGNE